MVCFILFLILWNDISLSVYGMDQLGHGYSEGTRWLIPNGHWQVNRDDLIKFAKKAALEHDENTPLFMIGDSYGGCQVLHCAKYFQDNPDDAPKGFSGILLNAPAIIADLPAPPVVGKSRHKLSGVGVKGKLCCHTFLTHLQNCYSKFNPRNATISIPASPSQIISGLDPLFHAPSREFRPSLERRRT